MSTTTDSVAVVQRFYDGLRDDLQAASEAMSEDVVIRHMPGLPYGGEYHGRDSLFELVNRMREMVSAARLSEMEWHPSGDVIMTRTLVQFTSKASGESVEMRVVEVSTVRDGYIVELDMYYKHPEALAAILS
jgi:ketosteroid isomerase-like protein